MLWVEQRPFRSENAVAAHQFDAHQRRSLGSLGLDFSSPRSVLLRTAKQLQDGFRNLIRLRGHRRA